MRKATRATTQAASTLGTAISGVWQRSLAGQKLPIERPRVRKADASGEVPLEAHARIQSDDAMPQAALRRMVRGVSTRDYDCAREIDKAREGFGVARSCVSRGFVRVSAANFLALAERQFVGEQFAAIMIDGIEYAGETMIVALGLTAMGTERILGRGGAARLPLSRLTKNKV